MNTFREYYDINEADASLKKEIVARNLSRIANMALSGDRYVKKIEAKGQRENASLFVHMYNGDIFELSPVFVRNKLVK